DAGGGHRRQGRGPGRARRTRPSGDGSDDRVLGAGGHRRSRRSSPRALRGAPGRCRQSRLRRPGRAQNPATRVPNGDRVMNDERTVTAIAEAPEESSSDDAAGSRPSGHAARRATALDHRHLLNLGLRYTTVALLLALLVVATFLDHSFWTANNQRNLITQ